MKRIIVCVFIIKSVVCEDLINQEASVVILNGTSFYFILEPVMDMKRNEVKGYELLSRSYDGKINNEIFFKGLSARMLKDLLLIQVDFFISKCIENPSIQKNVFLNIPLEVVDDDSFLWKLNQLSKYVNINLEVQYQEGIVYSQYYNQLTEVNGQALTVWIDDVTDCSAECLNALIGVGVKIDKHAFWNLFNKKSLSLSEIDMSNRSIIVEGVENGEHLSFLRDVSVPFAQGYYWPGLAFK